MRSPRKTRVKNKFVTIKFIRPVSGSYDHIYEAGKIEEFNATIEGDRVYLIEGHGYGTWITIGLDAVYVEER